MRIFSRFLAKLSRSTTGGLASSPWTDALPGLLRAGLGAGIVLAAVPAAAQPAQPAQPPPAQPPAAQPPAAPAKAPADQPLMPAQVAAAPAAPPPAPPPDVDRDAKALAKQGADRPSADGQIGVKPSDVFAEDWWTQARPVFEIHGYYRVRSELFHNFALGRRDVGGGFWPQPVDNDVALAGPNGTALKGSHAVVLCGSDPTLKKAPEACSNNTQAGANMRFRLNPELHISDNLRVMAQIDMLDNLVLGSTPEGYYNLPYVSGTGSNVSGAYQAGARGGYTPLGAFATTQWAPTANQNSAQNSITVKRVWGEYVTPVGLLRFGRMPSHWGLGMVANSGDGHDSDWQSTSDRIMFVTGLKKYDLYFAGMWDFANEGQTSANLFQQQGQPYDLGQLDDVSQYGLVLVRRRNPEMQRLELAKGQLVVNGGIYFVYRNQFLANDTRSGTGPGVTQTSAGYLNGLTRRNAQAYIPDIWLQVLYRKFRFEAEAAMIYGSMDSTAITGGSGSSNYTNARDPKNDGYRIRQFGVVTQSEFRAIEDRLRVQFGFGWSSGDPGLSDLKPGDQELLAKPIPTDHTFSEFRFHPDYRVDLIFYRNILGRVQGSYYFRPSVEYDFTRDKNGQRIGGGAAVIWSRASEFIQTPGHARDLGVELNGKLYFQSKDGTLNDDPDKMGGFFTSLEYGVFFPLGGLGYLQKQQDNYAPGAPVVNGQAVKLETATAQMLRWYLGILF